MLFVNIMLMFIWWKNKFV